LSLVMSHVVVDGSHGLDQQVGYEYVFKYVWAS